MKYESDILKRLINTYGVVGNPRYISEIIKEFIVRGKERFPELFTYQSDWLTHIDEFGLNPTYTVSYTGQSFYAPNTLERPVKSAILKGNTLTNLFPTESLPFSSDGGAKDFPITYSSGKTYTIMLKLTLPSFKEGVEEVAIECGLLDAWSQRYVAKLTEDNTTFTFKFKNLIENSTGAGIRVISPYSKFTENLIINEFVVIEGDYTNIDIPFFEGILPVKMPVLTTSNEDGTKTNILSTPSDLELRGIGDVQDTLDLMTGELTQRIGEIVLDGSENGWVYGGRGSTTAICYIDNYFTTPPTNVITNYFSLMENRPDVFWNGGQDRESFCLNDKSLAFRIEKTKLKTLDSNGIKEWLSQNNLIIEYDHAAPIIKTVDLTILDQNGQSVKQLMSFNGGTHFNTKSLEGTPLPMASVSVETDLEETLKVCSLEGNTM